MSEEPLSKELLDELGTPKTSAAVESELRAGIRHDICRYPVNYGCRLCWCGADL